jgi:hypothetical protein
MFMIERHLEVMPMAVYAPDALVAFRGGRSTTNYSHELPTEPSPGDVRNILENGHEAILGRVVP